MRKFLSCIVVSAIIGCASVSAFADTSAVQRVVYVNGIQNTMSMAQEAQNKIKCILSDSPNPMRPDNTSGSVNHRPVKRNFTVDLAYNPYGFDGTGDVTFGFPTTTLREDERELFVQKTAEELYVDSLKKLQFPHDKSANADGSGVDWTASGTIAGYYADMTPGYTPTPWDTFDSERSLMGNNSLVLNREVVDADMASTQATIKSIINKMELDGTTVVIAHSQGNILTNLAYAAASNGSKLGGGEIKRRVRVVNLANTSQVSISNLNLTHTGDGMLFGNLSYAGLKKLATAGANWNRSTPSCPNWGLCDFVLDTPTMLAPEDGEATAIGEHGVLETYLSDKVVEVKEHRGVNYTPDAKRFRDRFEDLVYHAADSLQDAQEGWATVRKSDFSGVLLEDGWTAYRTTPAVSDGQLHVSSPLASYSPVQVVLNSFPVDVSSDVVRFRTRYRPTHISAEQAWYSIWFTWGNTSHAIDGSWSLDTSVTQCGLPGSDIQRYQVVSQEFDGCSYTTSELPGASSAFGKWSNAEMLFDRKNGVASIRYWMEGSSAVLKKSFIFNPAAAPANSRAALNLTTTGRGAISQLDVDFIEMKTLKNAPVRARPLPDPDPIPTPIDPIDPDPPTS